MPRKKQSTDEAAVLRQRLAETEETLEAIRQYLVDAFVIRKSNGDQVVTLTDANFPYRMMVESMNEGAATLIPDGTIFYSNSCFANMVQMDPESMIGVNFRDLIIPEEQAAFDDMFQEAGQSPNRGEFHLQAADGSRIPVQLSIYRLSADEVSGIAILATDITERILAEEKIRSLASELTLVEQEERHRISQILHDDLQQRLFAIRAHMALLNDTNGSDTTRSETSLNVEQIQSWLSEAITITRNLSINLSPVVLQGDGLMEAVSWLASQMNEQYGLQVEVETSNDLSPMKEHMRVLLFQSIRELLFNVVKHAGILEATVSLARENGAGRVTISDSGRGFDAVTVLKTPGAAHGILIIKDRLELMGCNMAIQSQPGSGTQIDIHVPLEKP